MPYAWYINPIETVTYADALGSYEAPRVSTFGYSHTSSVGIGSWVLSLVRGDDFASLDQDPSCELIFAVPVGTDPLDFIFMTFDDIGLTVGQENTLRSHMANAGIPDTNLTRLNIIETWLNRICESQGGGTVRKMYI